MLKSRKSPILGPFIALLVIGLCGPVHALDVTLRVPVELVNLPPSITEGYVYCRVHPANASNGTIVANTVLGEGKSPFYIKGTFAANVDVAIRNNTANPPSIGWRCDLFLRDQATARQGPAGAYDDVAGNVLRNYWVDASKPVRYTTQGIR